VRRTTEAESSPKGVTSYECQSQSFVRVETAERRTQRVFCRRSPVDTNVLYDDAVAHDLSASSKNELF